MKKNIQLRVDSPTRLDLNFKEDLLLGWELEHNFDAVASLVKALELGAQIPPVKVLSTDLTKFTLSRDFTKLNSKQKEYPDGGHRRAIAHYIIGKPLPCLVYYGLPYDEITNMFAIRCCSLIDDFNEFQRIQREDPRYLPL